MTTSAPDYFKSQVDSAISNDHQKPRKCLAMGHNLDFIHVNNELNLCGYRNIYICKYCMLMPLLLCYFVCIAGEDC